MKHNLIALAVATALITPMAAHAAPKVYGKLNVSLENIKDDTKQDDRWEMLSNASRFGVKGEDEVTATISAIYGIEWEVSTDGNDISGVADSDGKTAGITKGNGSKLDLFQRNRYIGLKHQTLGAIKFGKVDTLTKLAQGETDLFNDLNADIGKVIAGENRVNNVVTYESPKIADAIQVNVQIIPGEEVQDKTATGANCDAAKGNDYKCDDNGLFDAISASVVYNNEESGLYAALAVDQGVASTFNAIESFNGDFSKYTSKAGGTEKSAKTDIIRLVGSYNIKEVGLTINALYQQAERSEEISKLTYTPKLPVVITPAPTITFTNITPKETSYLLGAAYKVPAVEGLTLKLQHVTAKTSFDDSATEDVTLTQTSIGADYNLASKTKVFGYYSARDYENENNIDTGNGKAEDYKVNFLAVGIEHKF